MAPSSLPIEVAHEALRPQVHLSPPPVDPSEPILSQPKHQSPESYDSCASKIIHAGIKQCILDETPDYTMILHAWGPGSHEGMTLFLFNTPPAPGIQKPIGGSTVIAPIKLDNFHQIPTIVFKKYLPMGRLITRKHQEEIPHNFKKSQQVLLEPGQKALIIDACWTSKFNYEYYQHSPSNIRQLKTQPTQKGTHKGALVILLNERDDIFHACFHETEESAIANRRH